MEQILVSVICNTYNHEDYIKTAIDSFLMQKTTFPFEILIHDDASTDKTPEIIKEYEKKYPDIIKAVCQKENQHSQHIRIMDNFQLPRAKGKYVAICEGDDYWTDPEKLQKQADAMEKHPEADISAHKAVCVKNGKKAGYIGPCGRERVISAEEVILGGGGFVPTNSLMLRKEVMQQKTPMKDVLALDYVWQIQGALRGGMLYLPQCMSAYRVSVKGSWSVQVAQNKEAFHRHNEKVCEMLDALDSYTSGKYHTDIKLLEEYTRLSENGEYKALMQPKYRKIYKLQSGQDKFKTWIRAYFPTAASIVKNIVRR